MPKKPIEKMEEYTQELKKKRSNLLIPLLMDSTRSIDHYSVSEIYDHLEKITRGKPCKNMDVVIHSAGGDADAAYHLATIFQELCEGKLTMIVPRYAKSAATLLTCAGDVIAVELPSELGPVDPQIQDLTSGRWISVSSIYNTIEYLKNLPRCPCLRK